MIRLNFTNHFFRKLKKLPPLVQEDFWERAGIFEKDMSAPQLKTHKLRGLKNCWSFSVNFSIRVVFRLEGDTVTFLEIGDHSIYDLL